MHAAGFFMLFNSNHPDISVYFFKISLAWNNSPAKTCLSQFKKIIFEFGCGTYGGNQT